MYNLTVTPNVLALTDNEVEFPQSAVVLQNNRAGSSCNERDCKGALYRNKEFGNFANAIVGNNGGVTLSLFQEHP